MRGGERFGMLWGSVECPDLVALSVYDTKPANFFLWKMRSWCVTSMKTISMTRHLRKWSGKLLLH